MMLSIYIVGLIKPTLPVVKDFIAHTFFEASHMATIHYENGRYHLHLELSEEAKTSNTQQGSTFSDNEALFSHLKNDELVFHFYTQTISEINSLYSNVPTDVTIPTPLLPPEC